MVMCSGVMAASPGVKYLAIKNERELYYDLNRTSMSPKAHDLNTQCSAYVTLEEEPAGGGSGSLGH